MNKTKISYLNNSWNPYAMRCNPISVGCKYCWHLAYADRLALNSKKISEGARKAYAGERPPFLVDPTPTFPKRPSVIGVQFMGDLFHDHFKNLQIARIIQTISNHPEHKFILLTKRIMKAWCFFRVHPLAPDNLWLGVSVCTQSEAIKKLPILSRIKVKHILVSIEPIIEPVFPGETDMARLPDWIIAGCEKVNGAPGRRAIDDWFRTLGAYCRLEGIPYYLKQKQIADQVVELPRLDGKTFEEIPNGLLIK